MAGTIINFLLVWVIYFLNLKISKKITGDITCGIVASLILILNNSFNVELFVGFSIPLSLIFYQLIVYIFLFNEKIDLKLAALLGLLAGLNINTRFDTLLPMLSLLLLISLKNKKISTKETLCFFLVLFTALLPWIIYSKTFFDTYFVSDNSRATLATIDDNIDFYFPFEVDTIFTDFSTWVKIYFTKKLPLVLTIFYITLITGIYYIIPTLFFKNEFRNKKSLTHSYMILGLVFLALLGTTTISGFFWEIRYFIPIIWFLSLIIMFYYPSNRKYLQILLIAIIAFGFYVECRKWVSYYNNREFFETKNLTYLDPDRFRDVVGNLENPKENRILFIHTVGKFYKMFSILTGVKSFPMPGNIYRNEDYLHKFIDEYPFDYIYVDTKNFTKFDMANGIFIFSEECNQEKYEATKNSRREYENYSCIVGINMQTGILEIIDFNPKIFTILGDKFEIEPTKNPNLYRVRKK